MIMYQHHQQFYPPTAQMPQPQPQPSQVPMHQPPPSSGMIPPQQQQPSLAAVPPTSMAPHHHAMGPPPGAHYAPPMTANFTQQFHHHQYMQMMQYQTAGPLNHPPYGTPPPMEAPSVGAANAGAPPPLNSNIHHNVGFLNYHHPQMFPPGQSMQHQYIYTAQPMFNTPPPHIVAQEQHNQMLNDAHMPPATFKTHEYFRKPIIENNLPNVGALSITESAVAGVGAVRESPQSEEIATPAAQPSAEPETTTVVKPTDKTTNTAPISDPKPPTPPSLRDMAGSGGPSPAKPISRPKTPPSARPHDDHRSADWRSQARSHDNVRKGKFAICYYCQHNGKPESEYKSHSTMHLNSVACPLLREVGCKECGKTGNEAHPEINCPKRKHEHDNFEHFAQDVSGRVGGGGPGGSRYGGGGGSGHGYGHYGGPPRNAGGHRGGGGPRNVRRN